MQIADPTRSPGSKSRGIWGTLGCAALLAGAGVAVTVSALNSDTVIALGFDRALAALPQTSPPARAAPFDGVAGTEDYWLRAPGNANIVQAVSVGQQIRLTDNGTVRHLTITSVRDGGDAQTHIDTSPVRARVALITCREEATGRETRLRLEGGHIREIAVDAELHAL